MAFTGLKIISSIERPKVMENGRLGRVLVITIKTDLGNTGNLEIDSTEAEKLTDDQLAERIAQKAAFLDRAHLL